jgi:predicted RNA-binding Zn ribbon-like protein
MLRLERSRFKLRFWTTEGVSGEREKATTG